MNYKEFITNALQESCDIAAKHFGKVTGTTKPGDNNQVLTEADLAIGRNIISLIKKEYPEHNIIDEEAGIIDNGSEFTWVVDPIDGTSNFANGVVTYGIIMGLLKQNMPIAGGVALPALSQIYVAEKGSGAFCNGEKVLIQEKNKLLSSLVAYGIDGHQENPSLTKEECMLLAEIVLSVRNLRMSGCIFDAMMVAKGKYGAFLGKTSKIWDHVGVQIVVEEAGGMYTDFYGKTIDYTNPLQKVKENYTWCMGEPTLHQEIQRIIHNSKSIV
jgi:myo-inositol-1(or 4)-monophosphatase